ncbi:MAG: ATP synthase F1 subunit delta [Crocinitomicaceae bacterium]|nr:ATP synthase F1 subunit delta [Crocinitomicaceae bacterium]
MKNTKVAARYARALLDLAIEQKNVDSVLGDMQVFSATVKDSSEFELLLSSPVVKADKKIEIFKLAFEPFEKSTQDFIAMITNNGREAMLGDIAEAFEAQVKEHRGIVPMTITSAVPLDDSTRAAIMAKVQSSVEGTLEVEEKVDESLIGGFVVRMGDQQIDASVASQLNNLKQRLTR